MATSCRKSYESLHKSVITHRGAGWIVNLSFLANLIRVLKWKDNSVGRVAAS